MTTMVKLRDMFKTSLYIGVTGYGGPAILAHMKNVLVKEKKWVSEKRFMEGLSLSQLLPGAVGVTLMGYLGYRMKKYPGAAVMTIGFAFPAFMFIVVLSQIYFQFGQLHFVKSLFTGMGAMVIALLLNALRTLGKAVFPSLDRHSFKGLLIAMVSFAGIFYFHANIVYLVLLSGFLGFLFYFFAKDNDAAKPAKEITAQTTEKNNLSPLAQLLNKMLPWLLALTIMGILISPARMLFAEFFKIGLLAFGGGFTSIPLIQHAVVDTHKWIDLLQFRDGIAMGQITPGPVLITATFIGFKVLGLFGAVAATLGIFLPSLIAVVILSSFHNRIRDQKITRVIMKGLLAGFIGLILATTINFGLKSLINWQTWSIFIASAVTLLYFKKDPLWVILGTIAVSLFII
ncbi:MAG: chromate efflux transporter [Candidatus Margulisbacteria bacterium]|nr:chromate efflux transporter [Candidatus Margulisiibacteriota bacterium]